MAYFVQIPVLAAAALPRKDATVPNALEKYVNMLMLMADVMIIVRGQSRHPNNRGGDSNSNALGQIPVIQPLQGNLSMSNSTDTNATSLTPNGLTIPFCNGIVGGPCYDAATKQIIP
jgi:hypothetical protein